MEGWKRPARGIDGRTRIEIRTRASRRTSTGREIRLLENDDGWWTAIDEATDVASQGETREAALENLDEAVALHQGEGEPIEDEEAFLQEVGIDPEEVEETEELPEFMQ